jgi:hypothetical protein
MGAKRKYRTQMRIEKHSEKAAANMKAAKPEHWSVERLM